jgi:small-conductance mechanosensitive channel
MLEAWNGLQAMVVPFVPALLIVALAIVLINFASRKPTVKSNGYRFRSQLIILLVVIASLVGVILSAPLDSDTRGQLLTLLGFLLTAIITLSSPTIAANAMAGFMLRSLHSFSPGDFIKVGEYFGRVTEQDLFHTEIQTDDRDLLTIPNLYLATNPVKVVHASGTIVSAQVSLGYDVDHQLVEGLLLQAAIDADLTDPFVYIMELGDYSVVYKVSGFLENIKQLLSTRSQLRCKMMDCLHEQSIEIASPSIMYQRRLEQPLIPKRSFMLASEKEVDPEALVFDKADRAQQIGELEDHYQELKQEIAGIDTSVEGNEALKEKKLKRLKAIKRASKALEKQNN